MNALEYQTGLYYLKVHNVADYRRDWGNDAGAWFATTAQYNRLDRPSTRTAASAAAAICCRTRWIGLIMSFNSPAGVQDIQNESIAAFGQVELAYRRRVHGDHGRALHA